MNTKNTTSNTLRDYLDEIGSGLGLYHFLRYLKSLISPEAELFHSILKLISLNLRYNNFTNDQLLFWSKIDLDKNKLNESLDKLKIHFIDEEKDGIKEFSFRFLYNEFKIYSISSPLGVGNIDLINLKNEENIKGMMYAEEIFIQNNLYLLKKQQYYKKKNEELRFSKRKAKREEKKKKKQLKREKQLNLSKNLPNN